MPGVVLISHSFFFFYRPGLWLKNMAPAFCLQLCECVDCIFTWFCHLWYFLLWQKLFMYSSHCRHGEWLKILFTLQWTKCMCWGKFFLFVILGGPVFLVKLLHRFLCGSAVCQISASSLLKTSVEWSNGFTADSWVFSNFLLRDFHASFYREYEDPFIFLESFKFFGSHLPSWGFPWRTILAIIDSLGSPCL